MDDEIFARLDKMEDELKELKERIQRIESFLRSRAVATKEAAKKINNKKPEDYSPHGDYIKDMETEKFEFGFKD